MAKKTNKCINGYEYYRKKKTIGKRADGTPIIKYFYGSSKKEADEKAREFIDNINKGMNENYKNITIEQLTDTWLYNIKYHDNNFKPSSFSKYEGIYRNYIKDSKISYLKVFYTKSIDIQVYYNELADKRKNFQPNKEFE